VNTYLQRFRAMVDALRANPQITITDFTVQPPATDAQLAAARAYWPLDADMEAFYRQCNGLTLRWEAKGRDGDAVGAVRLWGVQDVFRDQRNRLWDDDDSPFRSLHPFDHFADEACAALSLKPGRPAEVFYHYCGEELSTMQLNFRGYLELLLKSRGFWYWQRSIAAPEHFNAHHPRGTNEINFRKYGKELFKDYRDADFVRVDQDRIDGISDHEESPTQPDAATASAPRRRFIEGTWTCGSCEQAELRGRLKRCPYCGSAREAGTGFNFGERDAKSGRALAATVVDVEGMSMAAAGADWFCANCDSSNPAGSPKCGGCGSSAEFAALAAPMPPPEPPPVVNIHDEPSNGGGGAVKAAGAGCGLLFVMGVIAVVCLLGVLWFTRTTTETGQVTSASWTSQVHLERWTGTEARGWRDELKTSPKAKPPVNGTGERVGISELSACKDKVRKEAGCETKTRKEACGTEEKCKQKDLGNGFAEEICEDVTKYCQVEYEDCWKEQRDDWCSYDRFDWKRVDTHERTGMDNNPLAAEPFTVSGLDRSVSEQTLKVDVRFRDQTGTWTTQDLARFQKLTPGTQVDVDVTRTGSLTDVRLAGAK